VLAELRPGKDLKELLERAGAAGERDEPFGELGHHGLALVHRADDVQAGEASVGDLAVHQRHGYDASDLATRGERGVGDRAHQGDVPAAVDQFYPHRCQRLAQCQGSPLAGGVVCGVETAEDAYAIHLARTPGR
jgi:hypothetical protein